MPTLLFGISTVLIICLSITEMIAFSKGLQNIYKIVYTILTCIMWLYITLAIVVAILLLLA